MSPLRECWCVFAFSQDMSLNKKSSGWGFDTFMTLMWDHCDNNASKRDFGTTNNFVFRALLNAASELCLYKLQNAVIALPRQKGMRDQITCLAWNAVIAIAMGDDNRFAVFGLATQLWLNFEGLFLLVYGLLTFLFSYKTILMESHNNGNNNIGIH